MEVGPAFRLRLGPPSAFKVIVFLSLAGLFSQLSLFNSAAFCILPPRQFNYKLFHVHVRIDVDVDGTRTTLSHVVSGVACACDRCCHIGEYMNGDGAQSFSGQEIRVQIGEIEI